MDWAAILGIMVVSGGFCFLLAAGGAVFRFVEKFPAGRRIMKAIGFKEED